MGFQFVNRAASIRTMSPAQNAPPPFVIDSEDHGGIILVTVAMLMVFVVLFLGIRIYMRFDVGGRWDNDDSVLVVATVRIESTNFIPIKYLTDSRLSRLRKVSSRW